MVCLNGRAVTAAVSEKVLCDQLFKRAKWLKNNNNFAKKSFPTSLSET